ncbi:MAG: DUF2958 domain-containing protein [Chitinophagaceae bacterium]|nr:DUF2958 domain-containing protein [Chitinophagaceae bacterium]
MEFLTEEQEAKLLHNGAEENRDQDHAPVVKLFFPGTHCVWLLNELVPDEPGIAFGLCDLAMGFPELGYLSLDELAAISINDMTVKRDDTFKPQYPMSVYAEAARNFREITEDPVALQRAKAALEEERQINPKPE